MIYSNNKHLINEQRKMQKYCEKCGHTMSFYAFEKDKKVCNYCGTLNYRNDLVKFKDKLQKAQRAML